MKTENLRQSVMDIAEILLRERGYNGWSYQDISAEIGIKKASIHYYFPRKEDLGCALIVHYHAKSTKFLNETCQKLLNAPEKLEVFVKLYGAVLDQPHSFCLCGMLAADLMTLPETMQEALKNSFNGEQAWVSQILSQGVQEGSLRNMDSIEQGAYQFVSCLQGMLLIARLKDNPQQVFFENAKCYLKSKLI
jgi:TetR/AcrR family transcriptional repressor of nem operon